MNYHNITVVIPALNPDKKLLNLINELHDNGFDDIIVVDDGSDPKYRGFFPDSARFPFCTVLTHRRNRGKGAALKSAFKFFLENRKGKAGVVTIDADGQHLTNDIINCVETMEKNDKVVLGCRDFSKSNVPARSRFGNKTTSLVFRLFCGVKVSDTQTGLRVIPARYLRELIMVEGTRYEYETNMLLEFKRQHIDYMEVKIDTVYLDDNKSSHFRPIVDSFRIYKLVLAFVFSSLISMFVELVIFYLTLKFVFDGPYDVILGTIVARIVSSAVNFSVNRAKVFHGSNKMGRSILRYIILAIPLAAASIFSIKGLSWILNTDAPFVRTLLKMVVDTALFFVSFRIQQNWVFAPDKTTVEKHRHESVEKGYPVVAVKKLTVGRVILRVFAGIGTAILYLVVSLFVLLGVVANGPSSTFRDALVLSAMQASATKWVPGLFLSDAEVQKIVDNSYVDSKLTIDSEDYGDQDEPIIEDEEKLIDGMKYITESHDNFKAYILLIPDPSRVFVGVSSNNFETATEGMRIFKIAQKYDCIAAINGGEFADEGGTGTGARPIGLTYSDGKFVWGGTTTSKTFIGIDKNNRLVVSEGMTKARADELGIRDSVCFQNGNVLINSDESGVHIHYKEGNTGAAQRTAIGQREDGTFVFVVTDGRTANSLGATYNDIIDIMVSYKVVNAGMLDGGSSAMMYYENYYDKYEIDKSKLDKYQQQGLTNKYKAFYAPRRIPTFFCVRK